ncbi:MAG: hypothetical protein GX622_00515, partial [Bacteroidales bacterium]|nr:hypothetical protein [Bacteroidales bacterium]
MNMTLKPIINLAVAIAIILLASCSREPVPPPEPEVEYITIEQLRSMNTQGITTVDTLVYIQGIITLTPELGNIPAFVAYIQDSTAGI